ncbi:MAG TPA: amidohydrolase family protein [Nocardioides sp.]|jgi:N-acetylglucosamine-6-phosphate deacetylase|nr:amidohydrolase family protein [Nocardioides sp.]
MTTEALAGRIVTTAGIVDDGVLEVRPDGTIGYVGPASGWSGPTPERVDTLAPGYVDIHCHGGGGHTVTSPDPAEVASVAAHHLSRGTTTMLASLVSASTAELLSAIGAIASVVATGSSVVGCHVEGPFLDTAHRGAHDPACLRLPGSAELAGWLSAGVDDAGRPTVRMVTLAPELPGATAAVELLERSGVVVGLGHTGADAGGFGDALRSSHRPLVTHLFNGMEPMHHRRPGPVAASLDALARGATHVELIADGVHLADETVHLVFEVDPGRHVVLVSDAMEAAGMPDGDYELGPVRVRVSEGRAWTRTEPPSLAGGTSHAADLVRHCVVEAGVDPAAAVAAATSTPAALLGMDDRGSLVTGLRADLVVLDAEWRVRRVMRGGDWVR